MEQKRFYSYALATSLLISSFGGLVNVSAAIVILEVAQKQKVFSWKEIMYILESAINLKVIVHASTLFQKAFFNMKQKIYDEVKL